MSAETERREKYAAAIRDRVRLRFGASVRTLAAQDRSVKMTFSEAEVAADAAMAVADAEQADRPSGTVELTEADRKFLSFALDEAAETMCHRDGFTDEDWALLERWRHLTDPPTA